MGVGSRAIRIRANAEIKMRKGEGSESLGGEFDRVGKELAGKRSAALRPPEQGEVQGWRPRHIVAGGRRRCFHKSLYGRLIWPWR